jgi:hypothetical protein
MNQCNECKFYSGDNQQGLCHAIPPKLNLAFVCGDWTEEQLQDASVRPMVMADDLACTFFQMNNQTMALFAPHPPRPGVMDW